MKKQKLKSLTLYKTSISHVNHLVGGTVAQENENYATTNWILDIYDDIDLDW